MSEPTELRLPETPLVLLYAGIAESTFVACAMRAALPARVSNTASGAAMRLRFIDLSFEGSFNFSSWGRPVPRSARQTLAEGFGSHRTSL